MSGSTYDEDVAGSSGGSESAASDEAAELASIETRLEELADEISRSIESGPVAEREALHDFAVSLVRERLPVALAAESRGGGAARTADPSKESPGSTAASLVGYGVLLIPVGFLLGLVFVPVGVMLFFGGSMLVVCGLVMGLVTRLGRSRRRTGA